MADGRLEKLADDLVQHWDERLEALDGKGHDRGHQPQGGGGNFTTR